LRGIFVNHCHVFPKGCFNKDKPKLGTPDDLLSLLKRLGIDRAVVFAPFEYKVRMDPNEWLSEALPEGANLIGFATINPVKRNSIRKLEKAIDMGLKGIKIHPPIMKFRINDYRAEAFYSLAEEYRLPLVFHTGVHGWLLRNYVPILLDDVAQAHPDLPIIIEHIGGAEFYQEALAVLRNNENMYAGITSTLQPEDEWHIPLKDITKLIRVIGAHRIIYGTDYRSIAPYLFVSF